MGRTSVTSDRSLAGPGFVHITDSFACPDDAWVTAQRCIEAMAGTDTPLDVIGDFVLPPPDGAPTRDFQTLHIDFGVPLVPGAPVDIARFTALHIPCEVRSSDALTRLVPLRSLLSGGSWPDRDLLLIFDNLSLAHGRRGVRHPGELRQRVFGHRALAVAEQAELRDRLLALFGR